MRTSWYLGSRTILSSAASSACNRSILEVVNVNVNVVFVSLSSQNQSVNLGSMTFAVILGGNDRMKKISQVNEEKVGKTRPEP